MNSINNSTLTGPPNSALSPSEEKHRGAAAKSRWITKAVTAAVFFSLGLLLVDLFFLPFRHVYPFIQDDAFYYFEIARRIGLGQGSTCDGITKTNGYHPLWLLMLVPLSPVVTASREWGARLAVALAVLLLGGALFLLRAVAARLTPRYAWLALLYSWSALIFSSIYGMESALAAFLLGGLLWLVGRREAPSSVGEGVLVGLVSALLILSRLDSLWYVLVLDILWGIRLMQKRQETGARIPWLAWAMTLMMQAVLLGAYLAVNEFSYGHLLTVSALAKSARFGGISLIWLRGGLTYIALLSLPLGAAAVWVSRNDPQALPVQIAAGGTVLTLLEIVVRGSFETLPWYYTLPVFCGGLFVATLMAHLRLPSPWSAGFLWAAVAAAVLFLGVGAYSKLRPETGGRYGKALWIAAHARKDAVFAEPDCGALSYASERSYLNMDGLTNSFGFQRAIQQDRVAQWLTKAGLNTVILQSDHPPLRTCDGRWAADVRIWRGMSGDVRHVHTMLIPDGPLLKASPFQLWHVTRIVSGSSKDIDACTKAAAAMPKEKS